MSIRKQLRVIQGGNNSRDYSCEELIESITGKYDEFTKYRIRKEINKKEANLIKELKYNN